MIAIDTNILVCLVVGEPVAQVERIKAAMERDDIIVPVTVILEAEWVLRRVLRLERTKILAALDALLGLERMKVESPTRLRAALSWSAGGMDFADALHLAGASDANALTTFDQAFIRSAARQGAHPPVREP